MKVKVSEAEGQVLDWMVAKCEWVEWTFETATPAEIVRDCRYSTDWSQAGPIIEREQIDIMSQNRATGRDWIASIRMPWHHGPTPLIAAMRCYVTSKLGYEVDVPEVLK